MGIAGWQLRLGSIRKEHLAVEVTSTLDGFNSQITALSNTLNQVSDQLTALSSVVSSLNTTLSSVGTQVQALSTEVSTLSQRLDALETDEEWLTPGTYSMEGTVLVLKVQIDEEGSVRVRADGVVIAEYLDVPGVYVFNPVGSGYVSNTLTVEGPGKVLIRRI